MKLFRAAASPWADSDFDLLSGEGAARNPGRWNFVDELTTYCAETSDVALSEAGWHEILFHLQIFRINKSTNLALYQGMLLWQKRVLAEIDCPGLENHLVDLSTPAKLSARCDEHGVRITLAESRRSSFLDLGSRTQKLANAIRETSAAGIITKSARSNGHCVVLFQDQFPSSLGRPTVTRTEVLISASANGKIWSSNKVEDIEDGEVIVSSLGTGRTTFQRIPVLSLP